MVLIGEWIVTNSGGSLADIWAQDQRSVPFALFTTGSSLGPVVAPVVGGFVTEVSLIESDNVNGWADHCEEFVVEMVSRPSESPLSSGAPEIISSNRNLQTRILAKGC